MNPNINPSQSAKEIIVSCLTRQDLFKFEHTGYELNGNMILSAGEIQKEMNRRSKLDKRFYLTKAK